MRALFRKPISYPGGGGSMSDLFLPSAVNPAPDRVKSNDCEFIANFEWPTLEDPHHFLPDFNSSLCSLLEKKCDH